MEIILSFEGEEKGRWEFPKNVSKIVFDNSPNYDIPTIKEIEFYDTKTFDINPCFLPTV